MATRLDTTLEAHDYNSLIASVVPAALVTAIEITPGDTDLAAGTVLVKTSEGTAYAPINAALTGNDLVVVLADDVEKGTAAVTVEVFKAGNFVRNRLVGASTYTITSNDFKYMAQAGIYSEQEIN